MTRRPARLDWVKRQLRGSAIEAPALTLTGSAPLRASSDRTAVAFRHCQTLQLAERKHAEIPMLPTDPELPPVDAAHCVSHDQHLFSRQHLIQPAIEDPIRNNRGAELLGKFAL